MILSLASEPRPGHENEDFVAASADCVVVLDGAGTPAEMDIGCGHGVAWFVRELGTALHGEASRARGSLSDCLAVAITRTADLHRDTCAVDDPLSPSATVTAVRVRGESVEWLVLGDSTVVLDCGGEVEAVSDRRLSAVAQEKRTALAFAEEGTRERRRTHSLLVHAERAMRNTPGGYWVAAADPHAAMEAITGTAARTDFVRAALLTDGAARLVDIFTLADWPGCLDLLEQQGPGQLISRVRQAELSDPDLERWPRSKPHDDATAAFIRF